MLHDMDKLTKIQARVLAFVRRYIETNEMPPTRKDICDEFGWTSNNAAQEHLRLIAKKGYIKILPDKSRGIQVL